MGADIGDKGMYHDGRMRARLHGVHPGPDGTVKVFEVASLVGQNCHVIITY